MGPGGAKSQTFLTLMRASEQMAYDMEHHLIPQALLDMATKDERKSVPMLHRRSSSEINAASGGSAATSGRNEEAASDLMRRATEDANFLQGHGGSPVGELPDISSSIIGGFDRVRYSLFGEPGNEHDALSPPDDDDHLWKAGTADVG